jgi:hypothetical protein
MCSEQKAFMFSDVNQGPPQGTCKDEILTFISGNSIFLAIFLLTIGIAGLISFGASFGIQYMKQDYNIPYAYKQ